MATVKAVNVTKYDTGGGDNVIPDGFIKSVEKVWIDSYAVTAAIPSTTDIVIGRLPAGKVLTDVIVHMPAVAASSAILAHLCTGSTTSTTTYFGTLILGGDTQKTTFDFGTAATLHLMGDKFGQAAPTDQTLYLRLGKATTLTGVTIRSIVKYT